jgi:hypothetical protein
MHILLEDMDMSGIINKKTQSANYPTVFLFYR